MDCRLFEGIVQRVELREQGVHDSGVLLVADGVAERDGHPVVGFLLVFPVLDFVFSLVFVDIFQREIDLLRRLINLEHLRDHCLSLADVIADVFDPAGGDLTHVSEPAFVFVFFQIDEHAEIGDFVDFSYDQLARFGVAAVFHWMKVILPRLNDISNLALDLCVPTGRDCQRRPTDRAGDFCRGFFEEDLFVLAVLTGHLEEITRHGYSWNSRRPARHPSRM